MKTPITYTQKIADTICLRLAHGETLRAICRSDGMPDESTVRQWVLDDRNNFAPQYARARDFGLDSLSDEIIEIANTPVEGEKTKITDDGEEIMRGDMIDHRRLQVDARKWYLSKLAPKRYGDKITQEHTGADGRPLFNDSQRDARLAALSERIKKRVVQNTSTEGDDVDDLA